MARPPVSRRWRRPAAWAALAVALWLAGCGSRLQPASLDLVERAEAGWQAGAVADYRVVVDVERAEKADSFQAEVQVVGGRIAGGTLRYREKGRWGPAVPLSETQAAPYTVPGLFGVLRAELVNSGRRDITVAFDTVYAFPRRLVLGPVLQDGQAVPGTETTLWVRAFEALPAGP